MSELKRHNGCKTDFLPELGFPEMFLKLLVLISHIRVWWENKYHSSPCRHFSEDFTNFRPIFWVRLFLSGKNIFPLWECGPLRRDSDNNGCWGPTDAVRPTGTIFTQQLENLIPPTAAAPGDFWCRFNLSIFWQYLGNEKSYQSSADGKTTRFPVLFQFL